MTLRIHCCAPTLVIAAALFGSGCVPGTCSEQTINAYRPVDTLADGGPAVAYLDADAGTVTCTSNCNNPDIRVETATCRMDLVADAGYRITCTGTAEVCTTGD